MQRICIALIIILAFPAVSVGYLIGYPDGSLRLDQPLTRQHVSYITERNGDEGTPYSAYMLDNFRDTVVTSVQVNYILHDEKKERYFLPLVSEEYNNNDVLRKDVHKRSE